jgi:hypothetical protein
LYWQGWSNRRGGQAQPEQLEQPVKQIERINLADGTELIGLQNELDQILGGEEEENAEYGDGKGVGGHQIALGRYWYFTVFRGAISGKPGKGRHQIESPKRRPKKSAQRRLPQSDLPQ